MVQLARIAYAYEQLLIENLSMDQNYFICIIIKYSTLLSFFFFLFSLRSRFRHRHRHRHRHRRHRHRHHYKLLLIYNLFADPLKAVFLFRREYFDPTFVLRFEVGTAVAEAL